jgi:dCTP deaminase
LLRIDAKTPPNVLENRLTSKYYVPFTRKYILHPRTFVLGITMEWIRIPGDCAAYVVGKSSWGRRGLIIATAAGVHSGFSGCLTLEMTNLGEIPVEIAPGMQICQLFLHKVETATPSGNSQSNFAGRRMPNLGIIRPDAIAEKLAGG